MQEQQEQQEQKQQCSACKESKARSLFSRRQLTNYGRRARCMVCVSTEKAEPSLVTQDKKPEKGLPNIVLYGAQNSDLKEPRAGPVPKLEQGTDVTGHVCASCNRENASFKCTRCKGDDVSFYCDGECQQVDWPRHWIGCGVDGLTKQARICDGNTIHKAMYVEQMRVLGIPELMVRMRCCSYCQTVGATKLCDRCHSARYCNRTCRVSHWTRHKAVCGKGGAIAMEEGPRERAMNHGFSQDEVNELLCQGVKPWDRDAASVLRALRGGY